MQTYNVIGSLFTEFFLVHITDVQFTVVRQLLPGLCKIYFALLLFSRCIDYVIKWMSSLCFICEL